GVRFDFGAAAAPGAESYGRPRRRSNIGRLPRRRIAGRPGRSGDREAGPGASGRGSLLGSAPALEFGVDEAPQIAIEHLLGAPRLVAGAMVLHPVVVDDIAADLGPPAAMLHLAAGGLGDLGLALFLGHLLELGLQDGQGLTPVL